RHSVGTCDRCETVIEPLASMQWWVKMKPLAGPAIRAVEEGRVRFHPERWNRVFLDWMNNIRDWCISRQLWWGHRIPVWYCDCGETTVSRQDPDACAKCGAAKPRQDEDVLDTWFSSALWPFSTMGWPGDTPDLASFYPTDFLTTDPDIIFRWEARMIFSALEFTGRTPFDDIYIHSTVLDKTGARMSRSKGIGVDPLEVFDVYGTDAARFTICYLESQSQSYRLWNERFELGRNFCNKVWNACRLVAPFLVAGTEPAAGPPAFVPVDHWIRSRFNETLRKVDDGFTRYTFSTVAQVLYDFFWHDICDWYLELAKTRMKQQDPAVLATLRDVLRGTLQILHPVMPFITEELWSRLRFSGGSILRSEWPAALSLDPASIAQVDTMRDLIVAVRNIRSEMSVPARVPVDCIVSTGDALLARFLQDSEPLVRELAGVAGLSFAADRPRRSSLAVLANCEVFVPLEGVVDVDKELGRIRRDAAEAERLLVGIDAKLANPNFAARARPEVVENERRRRAEFADKLARLRRQLEAWN
ncbi:class I tRNA ligase family protein, partial [candidate division WOR-3 bacterium]|nr:class I tRNA ligase family protein [candidate division WOR-3 bacterium]